MRAVREEQIEPPTHVHTLRAAGTFADPDLGSEAAVAVPTEGDIGHHHFRPFVGCLVSADSSADDDGSPDHSIAPSKLYLPIHLPMSNVNSAVPFFKLGLALLVI